uniref:Uncharacterized protein n=1 Tax=Schizaphis graminum TaxID=13262 RepID=A0A2S2NGX3_SCHGA
MPYSYFIHKLAGQEDLVWLALEKLAVGLSLAIFTLALVYWYVDFYTLIYEPDISEGFRGRRPDNTEWVTDSQTIVHFDQISNGPSGVHCPEFLEQPSGNSNYRNTFNRPSSELCEQSSEQVDDWASTYRIPLSSSYEDVVKRGEAMVPAAVGLPPGLDRGAVAPDQRNDICIDI